MFSVKLATETYRLFGPGPVWTQAYWDSGLFGPEPIWTQANLDPGLLGHRPILTQSYLDVGPWEPGPGGRQYDRALENQER